MTEAVIISACRTPVGKFGRSLLSFQAQELGAIVVKEAIKRAGIEQKEVDEVIMGNVISAGLGQNPARQAAIRAGLPVEVSCYTVNKVCGSGLKAVMLAAQSIISGDNNVVVAGGMESMSNSPYLIKGLRWGIRYGNTITVDSMINDGLWDAYNEFHMGITGEIVAERHGITRKQADEYAYQSHMRASDATKRGFFRDEIVPVEIKKDEERIILDKDECIREDTTIEKLSHLKPVFKQDGILTAGNSSQLSDGASALVVCSREFAERKGIKILARIVGYASGGVKPELVMEAPVPTTKKLLERIGLSIDEIDLFEHNEAYATASIYVRDALGIPNEKFNVNGGAIALGHPIGCSGARVLTTLIYSLRRLCKKRGLATLCLGGGNAVSMIVEV
jgi:acetyl-CoA C-acetyltransferase